MPTIQELNLIRTQLQQRVHYMGMSNMPTDPEERLRSSAAYQLAQDAWIRAEREYNAALASMSSDELYALVQGSEKPTQSLD